MSDSITIYTVIVTNLCNPKRKATEFRVYISQSDGLSENEKFTEVIEGNFDDTIGELTHFITEMALIYPNPSFIWRILDFKVLPGCNIADDPFFSQLNSNVVSEISRLKLYYDSEEGSLYIKQLTSFWEKNRL
jgi:hypothetical protein